MESIHRPINVRYSIIKTANLGLKHKPTTVATSNTSSEPTITGGNDTVTMDTVGEGVTNETISMDTSDMVKTSGGCHSNTTTSTTENPDLNYAGSVTMTTAQPATNITGHTGYLTFATLSPAHVIM